jgi:hypothetical protein
VLWSTVEFGFLHLDDAYATGSSMLPQKKNADIAELARGKTGRLVGHLTGLLTTLKGLPLSYNRDLQEDKEPLFDSLDQVERCLDALGGLIATATFDTAAMARAADEPASAATDLAEWLVQKGMPFRRAHELVGAVVRDSLQRRVPLPELVAAHPSLGVEAVALLEPGVAVTRRTTPGGAGPVPVAAQLAHFATVVRSDAERFGLARQSSSGHPARGSGGTVAGGGSGALTTAGQHHRGTSAEPSQNVGAGRPHGAPSAGAVGGATPRGTGAGSGAARGAGGGAAGAEGVPAPEASGETHATPGSADAD